MNHSRTVEQYIKTIYNEQQRLGHNKLHMKQLAVAMGVTPGTVTQMLKNIYQSGLINYKPRVGVSLTEAGRSLALKMIRRHRLIETFLVSALKYDWSEIHQEAEELEHAISDQFIERLDKYLGFPNFDPHGDPIPSESGIVANRSLMPLINCKPSQKVVISCFQSDDVDFLQMMKRHGIIPNSKIQVLAKDTHAETITVSNLEHSTPFVMSFAIGEKIEVAAE